MLVLCLGVSVITYIVKSSISKCCVSRPGASAEPHCIVPRKDKYN